MAIYNLMINMKSLGSIVLRFLCCIECHLSTDTLFVETAVMIMAFCSATIMHELDKTSTFSLTQLRSVVNVYCYILDKTKAL